MKHTVLFLILLSLTISTSGKEQQNAAFSDTLTVGVKSAPPFLIKENGNWKGVSVDLWTEIAEELDIKYKFKEYNLDNLTTALSDASIELSINPLTVTSERIKQFDYTQPFYISNLAIATASKDKNQFAAFIKNFFSADFFKALGGLIFLIFVFGFIIWLVEKKRNPTMFKSGWKGIADGFWWSAVTMTTVGYGDKAPVTPLGRIFGFVWMFTAIIVISGFTASIASSLTVNKISHSIENFNDLRSVSVGTVKGSSTEQYLNEKNVTHNTFIDLETAINQLYKGDLTAVVYDDAILKYSIHMLNMSDKIAILPIKFNKQYYAFAFPYDQNINYPINAKLMEMIEKPAWKDILSRYKIDSE